MYVIQATTKFRSHRAPSIVLKNFELLNEWNQKNIYIKEFGWNWKIIASITTNNQRIFRKSDEQQATKTKEMAKYTEIKVQIYRQFSCISTKIISLSWQIQNMKEKNSLNLFRILLLLLIWIIIITTTIVSRWHIIKLIRTDRFPLSTNTFYFKLAL